MKPNSSRRDGRIPSISLRTRPSRAKRGGLLSVLSRVARVSRAILREVFDESAYERFLARHQLTSSAAAYSSFCRERDLSRARRPRCC